MFSYSQSLLMHPGRGLRLLTSLHPLLKNKQCCHMSRSAVVYCIPKSYNVPEKMIQFLQVPARIRKEVEQAYPMDERKESLKEKRIYDGYEPLLEATRPFTCRIETYNNYMNKQYIITSGSGFVCHPEGYIATSSLCVNSQPYCNVVMNNGLKYDGRVEWIDEKLGLAVVRIEHQVNLMPCMTLSSSRDGQVIAVTGVPDKEHIPNDPLTKQEPFFPLGASISELDWFDRINHREGATRFGHVGGPVVNRCAEVVAVASISDKHEPTGIPVEYLKYYFLKKPVKSVITDPRTYGLLLFELSIPFLLDFDLPLKHFNPAKKGVVVVQCVDGCPAHEAGLRVNDVITQLNGRIPRTLDVTDFLSSEQDVNMIINRKGEEKKISMPYHKWPVNQDDSWL